jgi:hypothetical protein
VPAACAPSWSIALIDTMFDLPNTSECGKGGGGRVHHRGKQAAAAGLPRSGQEGLSDFLSGCAFRKGWFETFLPLLQCGLQG